LTIDWATLAWLQIRLRLWLRARYARQLALLLALGALAGGCVPATQFEESQSAAQVEREGRRRAEQQAQELGDENARLRQQMQQEKREIEERDQALSQAALDTSAQGKQRQDAEGMVEQLRGELARAGSHLQAFNDDKQKLEQALTSETARARALARLSRDVALTFGEPIATGQYTLDAEQSLLVLRVPRQEVLGDALDVKPEASRLLENVARLMQLHKQAKVRVCDASAPTDPLRVAQLVAALGERGLGPERFDALDPEAVATETADGPELVFGFSEP
jgi:hypothetical protein